MTVAVSSCSVPPIKRISGRNLPCGSDALAHWKISLVLPSSNILLLFLFFTRKPKREQPETSPENPASLISVINQTNLKLGGNRSSLLYCTIHQIAFFGMNCKFDLIKPILNTGFDITYKINSFSYFYIITKCL